MFGKKSDKLKKGKNRVATGIQDIDEILQGGIPKNSSVLVCGGPGSCKTIFSMNFIYQGAKKYNEKGLYVSFEQEKKSIIDQSNQFGWDLESLEKKGKIKILSFSVNQITNETIKKIQSIIKKEKIQRLVIDSLSTLVINAPIFSNTGDFSIKEAVGDNVVLSPPVIGDYFVQKFLYSFIEGLRGLDCTSLLIAEANPKEGSISRDTLSEFVCDGVIFMSLQEILNTRRIQIKKMRGTKHILKPKEFTLSEKGIEIIKDKLS